MVFFRIFKSFAVMGEQLLPAKWPTACHEASKLPSCPDFRTYKSSSSNNSGETPKHPRHHRSFSGKHGKHREEPVRRLRSVSSSVPASDHSRRPASQSSSRADLVILDALTYKSLKSNIYYFCCNFRLNPKIQNP